MSTYDPAFPYVVGMGWPPLYGQPINLDTGSEIGYQFTNLTNLSDMYVSLAYVGSNTLPPDQPLYKELLINLYPAGKEAATGPIRNIRVDPDVLSTLGTNATIVGSVALNVLDAIREPTDDAYILLTGPDAFFRVFFNVTGSLGVPAALTGKRILDVSVYYTARGPFNKYPGGLKFGLEKQAESTVWWMDEALRGVELGQPNTQIERSRFGELNPWWKGSDVPGHSFVGGGTYIDRRPWVYEPPAPSYGLKALGGAFPDPINLIIQTASDIEATDEFQLPYISMIVTYCAENRIGAGGLDITEGTSTGGPPPGSFNVPVGGLPALNLGAPIVYGQDYVVTVGQSYSSPLSVSSPVPVQMVPQGSAGQYTGKRGISIRKTIQPNQVPTAEVTDLLPCIPLSGYQTTPPGATPIQGSHPYLIQLVATGSAQWTSNDQTQLLLDEVAAEFVWIRFWARRSPGTAAPLVVSQVDATGVPLGPTAQISVADFDQLEELVDGWKRVTLRLSPSFIGQGTGTSRWAFTSFSEIPNPWQVATADGLPANTMYTYGGNTAFARIDGLNDLSADVALVLAQEMPEVTGLAVTAQVQDLALVDEHCGQPVEAIPSGIRYHLLTWDPVNTPVVAGWGAYEVQRQDDTMAADAWETIALITTPAVAQMADYEARVGVESRYRIRMLHVTGIEGAWSADVAATIAAPGVTGVGVEASVLIFSSNHNPDGNAAHAMVWDRAAEEGFTFLEADQVELQRMYQRDYQVAFRPLERGGVQFARTLLVNALGIPPSTMDRGFTGLRDLAWDTTPYVCVRDELNNRWLSTLVLPSGTVRRVPNAGHLELAQMTITEVTDMPAPVDGTDDMQCEGLAVSQGASSRQATTTTPGALAPELLVQDPYSRNLVGTWGTPPTGAPYTYGGLVSPTTLYTFDATSEGWVGEGATSVTRVTSPVHDGAGSLQATKTMSAGSDALRFNDNQAPRSLIGNGPTITIWALVPAGAPGTGWRAHIEVQDVAFAWIAGANTNLTPGTWAQLTFTPPPGLLANCRSIGVEFRAEGVGGAQSVYIDTVQQVGDMSVNGTAGLHNVSGVNGARQSFVGPFLDTDQRVSVTIPAVATGAPARLALTARDNGAGGAYRLRVTLNTNRTMLLEAVRRNAGVDTILDSATIPAYYDAGTVLNLHARVEYARISASAWVGATEPANWMVDATDTMFLQYGNCGLYSFLDAGNTNAKPYTLAWDNYTVQNLLLPVALATLTVRDFGTRSSVDTWGNPITGPPWQFNGGAPDQYDVTNGVATHNHTSVAVERRSFLNIGSTDYYQSVEMQFGVAATTGAPIRLNLVGRMVDVNNLYFAQLELSNADSQVRLSIQKRVGGSNSVVVAAVALGTTGATDWWRVTLRQQSSRITAVARNVTTGTVAQLLTGTHTDAAIDSGTQGGLFSLMVTGNTLALPKAFSFRNYVAATLIQDVDIRALIRPTSTPWAVRFGHQNLLVNNTTDAYWRMNANQVSAGVDVSDAPDSFTASEPPEDTGLVLNRRLWFRVVYDSASGGGNATATFYVSEDGSSWTVVGTATATMAPLNVEPGQLVAYVSGGATLIRAELRNGAGGALLASPDFEAQPDGTTQFTDAQGNVWSVDGGGLC